MMEQLTETGCYGYINDDNPLCNDCETGVDCMVQQNNRKLPPHHNVIDVEFNLPLMDDTAYAEWMKQVAKDVGDAFKEFAGKYWRL